MNLEAPDRKRFPGFLVTVLWISLIACVVLLLEAALRGSMDRTIVRMVMTFIGLVAGAFLAGVQIGFAKKRSVLTAVGLLTILASQASFLMLVWTNWMVHTVVWRLWWITMVPSVFTTHLMLIAHGAKDRPGRVERLTSAAVVWAGLMILSLGFRADVFAPLAPAFWTIALVPLAGTVAGSAWLLFQWMLNRAGGDRMAKRAAAAGMLLTHFIVLLVGFYVGRSMSARTNARLDDLVRDTAVQGTDRLSQDWYEGQSVVATFLGDTRLTDRQPFITMDQIAELERKLEPGDILLERRNWYLSNPFLPGFWPHTALYVGTMKDLEALGIADDPAVRKHRDAYGKKSEDGHAYTIIEALSEGVVLNTLEHSMRADYVAVLRPRATPAETGTAIVRAFANLGKPYDFNFDFDDRTKLVCTQVVYLSYEGIVDFQTLRVLGRNTMPAVEIARKHAQEKGTPKQKLEFIAFLDAVPRESRAHFADEDEFCKSVDRPRELVER